MAANDNRKPSLVRRLVGWVRLRIAYLRGWVENSGFYKRMQARKYDAPERSWWWIGVRALVVLVVLGAGLSSAYWYGKQDGTIHITQLQTPTVSIGVPKAVPLAVVEAWKGRALTCEAAAEELNADNRRMRAALNALPAAPLVVVPTEVKPLLALPGVAVSVTPRKAAKKPKECETWLCKLDKAVGMP